MSEYLSFLVIPLTVLFVKTANPKLGERRLFWYLAPNLILAVVYAILVILVVWKIGGSPQDFLYQYPLQFLQGYLGFFANLVSFGYLGNLLHVNGMHNLVYAATILLGISSLFRFAQEGLLLLYIELLEVIYGSRDGSSSEQTILTIVTLVVNLATCLLIGSLWNLRSFDLRFSERSLSPLKSIHKLGLATLCFLYFQSHMQFDIVSSISQIIYVFGEEERISGNEKINQSITFELLFTGEMLFCVLVASAILQFLRRQIKGIQTLFKLSLILTITSYFTLQQTEFLCNPLNNDLHASTQQGDFIDCDQSLYISQAFSSTIQTFDIILTTQILLSQGLGQLEIMILTHTVINIYQFIYTSPMGLGSGRLAFLLYSGILLWVLAVLFYLSIEIQGDSLFNQVFYGQSNEVLQKIKESNEQLEIGLELFKIRYQFIPDFSLKSKKKKKLGLRQYLNLFNSERVAVKQIISHPKDHSQRNTLKNIKNIIVKMDQSRHLLRSVIPIHQYVFEEKMSKNQSYRTLLYIIMPYIEQNLDSLNSDMGPSSVFPEELLLQLLQDIIGALQSLQEIGILFRRITQKSIVYYKKKFFLTTIHKALFIDLTDENHQEQAIHNLIQRQSVLNLACVVMELACRTVQLNSDTLDINQSQLNESIQDNISLDCPGDSQKSLQAKKKSDFLDSFFDYSEVFESFLEEKQNAT